jgi:hypothetical protein
MKKCPNISKESINQMGVMSFICTDTFDGAQSTGIYQVECPFDALEAFK